MQRIHCLIGLINLPTGEAYAECACGTKAYGDNEDEAWQGYVDHRGDTGR